MPESITKSINESINKPVNETLLTPTALLQLRVIAGMGSASTGFITGFEVGRYTVIRQLLPVPFDETTIDDVYGRLLDEKVLGGVGETLVGVFFAGAVPFGCDWFVEDMIMQIGMKIKGPELTFYTYDRGARCLRPDDTRTVNMKGDELGE